MACVEGGAALNNLINCDKLSCLAELENATDSELWDSYLEGQSKLFFDSEYQWLSKEIWWQKARNILEVGSGNGTFLFSLANFFENKQFKGVELLPASVRQANEQYAKPNLIFQEGNAEIFNPCLVNSSDLIIFRIVLQHLENPTAALKNAFHYLSTDGYVVIIDTFDSARKTSHPIPILEETTALVAKVQKNGQKGNRKALMELQQALECNQSSLNDYYDIVSSNLDINGNVTSDFILFNGKSNRVLYFNHCLLFFTLLNRTYHINLDLSRAYDELQDYLNDEYAWTSPGMHCLVLKRKNCALLP